MPHDGISTMAPLGRSGCHFSLDTPSTFGSRSTALFLSSRMAERRRTQKPCNVSRPPLIRAAQPDSLPPHARARARIRGPPGVSPRERGCIIVHGCRGGRDRIDRRKNDEQICERCYSRQRSVPSHHSCACANHRAWPRCAYRQAAVVGALA